MCDFEHTRFPSARSILFIRFNIPVYYNVYGSINLIPVVLHIFLQRKIMRQIKHFETKEGISELMLFLDGDTVALTSHALSDRLFFSARLLQAMAEMGQDGIQNMLIDCEALISPEDIDIERFVQMERIISKQGIRFLLLDASDAVRRWFEPLLPAAVWIDSDAAGYFGETLKSRIRSSPK